jgi:hypothetical protein
MVRVGEYKAKKREPSVTVKDSLQELAIKLCIKMD